VWARTFHLLFLELRRMHLHHLDANPLAYTYSPQQSYFLAGKSVRELLAKIIVAKKSGRAANRDPAN